MKMLVYAAVVGLVIQLAALIRLRAADPGPKWADLTASFYGEECRGRTMANGKAFDPLQFTCASWDYPLGTRLSVSTPLRTVIVTCTDRGPAKRLLGSRQLDLSDAAFKCLARPHQGLVRVTVVRL